MFAAWPHAMNPTRHSDALIDEHVLESPDGRRVRFISAPAFATDETWSAVQPRLSGTGTLAVTVDTYTGADDRGGAAFFAHWRTVAEARGLVRRSEAARRMGAVQLEVNEESFRRAWRSVTGTIMRALTGVAWRFRPDFISGPFDDPEVGITAVTAHASELADLAEKADDDATFVTGYYASAWAQQHLLERGFTDVTAPSVHAPKKRGLARELDELARTGRVRVFTDVTAVVGTPLIVMAVVSGQPVLASMGFFAALLCAARVRDSFATHSARRHWRLEEVALRDELAAAGV